MCNIFDMIHSSQSLKLFWHIKLVLSNLLGWQFNKMTFKLHFNYKYCNNFILAALEMFYILFSILKPKCFYIIVLLKHLYTFIMLKHIQILNGIVVVFFFLFISNIQSHYVRMRWTYASSLRVTNSRFGGALEYSTSVTWLNRMV